MFSYIKLTIRERDKVVDILTRCLENVDSKIVKVNSMQTLYEFAIKDEKLKPPVKKSIQLQVESGSPAVVNRGKKLLNNL
jgi:hypothetical protein